MTTTVLPTTLLISSKALPRADELAQAARERSWSVVWEKLPTIVPGERRWIFYGGVDMAVVAGHAAGVVMLEPPLDQLARLPLACLQRTVRYTKFGDLGRIGGRWFVKPADSLAKIFDAGVYRNVSDMGLRRPVPPATPVLFSEPVEWLAEFRVWIQDGRVVTTSPYMSFGRPVHHQRGVRGLSDPRSVITFCDRVLYASGIHWPPAFVMDVGIMEDRGWGVVEFNPVWCSGLLGGDVRAILSMLERTCVSARSFTPADKPWVIRFW